jgi:DNA-binding NtrC family response regulator
MADILVIDDDRQMRRRLARILTRAGIPGARPRTAVTGSPNSSVDARRSSSATS